MKDLSPALKQFCEQQELLRLAYKGDDDYPRAVPLWFVIIEGVCYAGTDPASAKMKAIDRDPRVGWLIDGGPRQHYKGASMYGRAARVDDPGLRERIHRALGEKYFGSADHPKFIEIYGRADDADTVYLKLEAEGGFSWEY